MSKIVGLAAPTHQAFGWWKLLRATHWRVGVLGIHLPLPDNVPDLWLVVSDDTRSLDEQCNWLCSLNAPILLVTPDLVAAYALRFSIGSLSIICHPSRAAAFMEDMLLMTLSGAGGPVVFGPFQPRQFAPVYQVLAQK